MSAAGHIFRHAPASRRRTGSITGGSLTCAVFTQAGYQAGWPPPGACVRRRGPREVGAVARAPHCCTRLMAAQVTSMCRLRPMLGYTLAHVHSGSSVSPPMCSCSPSCAGVCMQHASCTKSVPYDSQWPNGPRPPPTHTTAGAHLRPARRQPPLTPRLRLVPPKPPRSTWRGEFDAA